MIKIDKRRNYKLVLDVETANMVEDPLVYDIGYAVTDRHGNIYESGSMIIKDIFFGERELMKSAYYANKIAKYEEDIKNGKHEVVYFLQAWKRIRNLIKQYGIKEVAAYNMNFDSTALNNTIRYITKSKFRWFFPYGVKKICIWHMACQVLFTQKTFIRQAFQNNWISPKGNITTNAEIAHRYLTQDFKFKEEHTGLEDVKIEVGIMARCFRQNKKMNKNINRACWRIPTQRAKNELGILA